MHFPEVLERFGATNDRLREILTSKAADHPLPEKATDEEKKAYDKNCKNVELRKKLETRVWERILEGIDHNVKNSRLLQAIDMAQDGAPVQTETVPLMMWAMGRIKTGELANCLNKTLGPERAKAYIQKSPDGNDLKINIPRICETPINLVRSYVTRRLAAMDSLWANQWPHFLYDARSENPIDQLKADVITEVIDQMGNQYGHRRSGTQWRRHMLLYAHSVVFPRSAWDRKIGWRMEPTNNGAEPTEPKDYIKCEGVDFVNPHPKTRYHDRSGPLSGINTDNGPKWIGYWDIQRYGSLLDNEPSYFNLNEVKASSDFENLVRDYSDFFNYYFDSCVLKFPECNDRSVDRNNRAFNVGEYATSQRDFGVLTCQHFEQLNPFVEGICDYNCDIWVRFVVGGAGTIIGAEWMPSLPAAVGGINADESREVNQSMASELLVFQDQATNIVTQMVEQLRLSFVQLWLIDKDLLDPAIVKEIENNAGNKTWWMDPHVLVYSGTKLKEMTSGATDPRTAFTVVQANIVRTVTDSLTALGQVLNLADRLLILSPNELGQPNPREVAAREVQEISTSTQSIYAFINEGPREQTAAVKRILFESRVTRGAPIVNVPIMGKYTKETIESAGFEVIDLEKDFKGTHVPKKTRIKGNFSLIIYDNYFESRDGAERAPNAQGAQVMTTVLQMLMHTPGIPQKLGLDRLLLLINAIIRMSGAPIDFQIDKDDGETDQIQDPAAEAAAAQPAGPPPEVQQMVLAMQQMDAKIQRLEALLSQAMGGGEPSAPQVAAPAAPPRPPMLALAS